MVYGIGQVLRLVNSHVSWEKSHLFLHFYWVNQPVIDPHLPIETAIERGWKPEETAKRLGDENHPLRVPLNPINVVKTIINHPFGNCL